MLYTITSTLNVLDFWATVCKTVCHMLSPMLSDHCSVCPVGDGALWPNGWTDQNETWRACRPRPWPHYVRWGPSSPSPKRGQSPQFLAHVYCGQTAGWIKMPLGMEVGLGLAQATLCEMGTQLRLPQKVGTAPIFSPCLL